MTNRPVLVLASASPRRVALLNQLGIAPDLMLPADIDERCATDGYTAPLTAAERRKVDKAFDAIALAVPRMKAPPRSTRSRLNSTLGSRARPG